MDRMRLQELKLQKLRETVRRCEENVPFYRKRFKESGISWKDINSLPDIQRIPFTIKDDLRSGYPFGFFAVSLREIVRIHASSGTTGEPTIVGYTRNDIEQWSELMARSLSAAGVDDSDIVQVAYGYSMLTGGLGFHYGAERVGASVVPMSVGNTKRQVTMMVDLGTTVLCSTPSYAFFMGEVAKELGFGKKQFKLRVGVFGEEPWSETLRERIERLLGISAFDIYGLSEVMGPGIAAECELRDGLHLFEDSFLPEIVNPLTGEVCSYGEQGELVLTTLNKEGMPLVRYRTGDITTIVDEPCGCGRTHVRMGRIQGRTDDMLIIGGANVFPSQVESVLMDIEGVSPGSFQLVVEKEAGLDVLKVNVEVSERIFSDRMSALEDLQEFIKSEIESSLGIGVKVKLVEPSSLKQSDGRLTRVLDRREF
ncbi:MAG: phenylacetate--CoA ligase [Actinomycetota bacterium]|nr:phenylacetate--CoA ligase [Actinomycetota bacterium]